MLRITPQNAVAYLRDHGQVPRAADISVRPLGGGVSNTVLLVKWADDSFILKQPLRRLTVDDEWIIDQSRVFNERDGMRLASEFLRPGSVPTVRFCDEENYVITMSRAAGGGRSWKDELIAGHVEPLIAEGAGTLLAELHNGTAGCEHMRQRFADPQIFIAGRVDPYFRTIAEKYPDLRPMIEEEIKRLLATRLVLIHGDYSPKNLMVQPNGQLMLIDFEIVHYGDPAFDLAFCLALLALKAIRFRCQTSQHLEAAKRFWRTYRNQARVTADLIETTTIRQLACILLARIDGKSKVEYITDNVTKDFVRDLAREILMKTPNSMTQLLESIGEKVVTNGPSP